LVKRHSKSLKIVPFESLGTVSYSSSIAHHNIVHHAVQYTTECISIFSIFSILLYFVVVFNCNVRWFVRLL